MADTITPVDKQMMITSFLEIAVGQTSHTAHQFLHATSWRLEEAIQLFYVGNDGGVGAYSSHIQPADDTGAYSSYIPPADDVEPMAYQYSSDYAGHDDGDDVRAPLPVRTESLYGGSRYRHAPYHDEEMEQPQVWGEEQVGTSTMENSQDNLASLYRPPFALMYHGSFEQAKVAAAGEDKWLIINLQSTKEFNSHMLNRDTWGNEAVAQTIKSNFLFWQAYDDTTEGMKVCTYYKVVSVPSVLILDPITGQKMRSWSGMLHPDPLLEALLPLMEKGPQIHIVSRPHKQPSKALASASDEVLEQAIAASEEPKLVEASLPEKRSYPPLPDEPKGEKSLLCRVGFRLPNGRRVQRTFLRSDPIQLLWSFCSSQLGEDKERAFRLAEAIPGSLKYLDYDSEFVLGDSGLSNSMISVTWE